MIENSEEHLDAEAIYRRAHAKDERISLATVYRTLDLFVEQGLASRIDLGEGRVMYATDHHGSHIHLVCRQCGHITDANPDLLSAFNQQLIARYQFAADLQHISLVGLCDDCQ